MHYHKRNTTFFSLVSCSLSWTEKSSTQQRRQSFEQHDDGCVDEVNHEMGFRQPSSEPIKESDSQCINPLPSKRSVNSFTLNSQGFSTHAYPKMLQKVYLPRSKEDLLAFFLHDFYF